MTESSSKNDRLQIDRHPEKQRKWVEHGILCGEVGPAMSLAEGSIREGETPGALVPLPSVISGYSGAGC